MTAAEAVRLTSDVVLFASDNAGATHVLLIRRRWEPYTGLWAFPGGHVDADDYNPGNVYDVETATRTAAARELTEETGLVVDAAELDLLDVYAARGRDPRGRYITWAYTASLHALVKPAAADDATDAKWWPIRDALRDDLLAFDHRHILLDALPRQLVDDDVRNSLNTNNPTTVVADEQEDPR